MTVANDRHTVVVGGGLVGSLLSVFLRERQCDVEVYERNPDMRRTGGGGGRSINLVATARGLDPLRRVGLDKTALELTVPVTGRMIHAPDGELSYQPYGKDDSECNYSISRGALNAFLVTEAERRGVRFHFEKRLSGTDLDQGRLKFEDGSEVEAPVVFGADGAASAVRRELLQRPGYEESAELLSHGYRELMIPVNEGAGIERHALHIWPRGQIMLMALPNLDGSFTVTIYMPHRGAQSFESLDTPRRLLELFETHFADAIPLIPDLEQAFFANPVGDLGTVKCHPWHLDGKTLLIGDAAHAIVPFFGQGMNCGFEDCAVLDGLMKRNGTGDWPTVFDEFDRARKPNTDAIADMALENFVEMSESVGDPRFLLRKRVEHLLEQAMPLEYRSRYSMVMYSHIPYRVAFEAGLVQREILDALCDGLGDAADCDLEQARRLIRSRLTPLLDRHSVSLDY